MSKDDNKNKNNFSVINGSGEDKSTDVSEEDSTDGRVSFESLVKIYGIDRAVARGVRSMMAVPADGKVKEVDFVRYLKKFTGMTPK